MKPPHDNEDGSNPEEGDLDLDSEKDALLSDPQATDGEHVLPDPRDATEVVAAGAGSFLGSHRELHYANTSTSATDDPVHRPLGNIVGEGNRTDAVGWRDLPRKRQLAVITLARLSEPLVQTSLQVCHPIP